MSEVHCDLASPLYRRGIGCPDDLDGQVTWPPQAAQLEMIGHRTRPDLSDLRDHETVITGRMKPGHEGKLLAE